MVDPDPFPSSPRRIARELAADLRTAARTIPPPAHGHRDVADLDVVAVGEHPRHSALGEPPRGPLAVAVARVEVVVTGAHGEPCAPGDAPQIFRHHHDLRAECDYRRHVERIAGDHNQVEASGDTVEPIELLQAVVQVGDEKTAHGVGQSTDFIIASTSLDVTESSRRKPLTLAPEHASRGRARPRLTHSGAVSLANVLS